MFAGRPRQALRILTQRLSDAVEGGLGAGGAGGPGAQRADEVETLVARGNAAVAAMGATQDAGARRRAGHSAAAWVLGPAVAAWEGARRMRGSLPAECSPHRNPPRLPPCCLLLASPHPPLPLLPIPIRGPARGGGL